MTENSAPIEETVGQAEESVYSEIATDPVRMPESISELRSDQQAAVLAEIVTKINQHYLVQDYVREIRVSPADLELVRELLESVTMPAIVRQLLNVVPSEEIKAQPGYIVQSQIETEWLARYYEDLGLMDWMKAKNAPLILTHKDLKMLFLLQGLDECKARRNKILLP